MVTTVLRARPFATYVAPETSRNTHPEGDLVRTFKCVVLVIRHFFLLFRPRLFHRALGSVARREPVGIPQARLSPGRGPWHVLWRFKVVRLLGEGFRARRTTQAQANPRTG